MKDIAIVVRAYVEEFNDLSSMWEEDVHTMFADRMSKRNARTHDMSEASTTLTPRPHLAASEQVPGRMREGNE